MLRRQLPLKLAELHGHEVRQLGNVRPDMRRRKLQKQLADVCASAAELRRLQPSQMDRVRMELRTCKHRCPTILRLPEPELTMCQLALRGAGKPL